MPLNEEELDQLHVQQRAVDALRDLLARIVNDDLPVISWSVHSSSTEAALTGTCDAEDSGKRRKAFEEWREALNADRLPEEKTNDGGTRLQASVTDNYLNLSILLIADI